MTNCDRFEKELEYYDFDDERPRNRFVGRDEDGFPVFRDSMGGYTDKEYEDNFIDIEELAENLMFNGYTSDDKDTFIKYYALDESEAETVCEIMREREEEE